MLTRIPSHSAIPTEFSPLAVVLVLGRDYSFLAPYITSGASINVTAAYLETPSSVIAALGGGNVNVTGTGEIPNSPLNSHGVGVSMDLGSQELAPFVSSIMHQTGLALGIYTTGGGDVTVTGLGTINVDSSRIGTFNGGDVSVTSDTGDVDAGSGGSTFVVPITVFSPDGSSVVEQVYANGIVAETLRNPPQFPAAQRPRVTLRSRLPRETLSPIKAASNKRRSTEAPPSAPWSRLRPAHRLCRVFLTRPRRRFFSAIFHWEPSV